MTEQELEILRFPIGRFKGQKEFSAEAMQQCIADIESFPERLKKETTHLSDDQLNTQYRPGGWTIGQVIHHCCDSHMNSVIRFKLALTEEKPTIKPYFEDKWAQLPDSKMDIAPALLLLEGLHSKWTLLLKSLSEKDLKKSFMHPEYGREIFLFQNVALYGWHCNHHLAHITELKKRKNWK
ncbi:MAG: YfiT family bacillithiol transferase [Flavobacteriales bacterium]